MEGTGQHSYAPFRAADFVAALDWWRDAGVDLDFADSPTHWLTPPADSQAPISTPVPGLSPAFAPPQEPQAPTRTAIGGDPADWPQDLPAFRDWWLAEPSLDGGHVRGRVGPRGPVGAEIMIVVAQPEAGDRETLLSGPEGRLLGAMLAAMEIAPEAAYLAAALPRHTPLADWSALAANGLGRVLAHHVGLVSPKRLIVLGSNILPLFGHDPAQTTKPSPFFYHEGRSIPLLGGREPGALLARPAWKAGFWQRWLEFSGQSAS